MALCCVCRSPIRGVVSFGPNGKRAHWGCAKWAAADTGLRGKTPALPLGSERDEADALLESDVAAVCGAMHAQMPWLEPWLESLQLSHVLQQAMAWCESMGATDIQEVKDNWDDFADFLGLDAAERSSLTTSAACSATASSSAKGGDSSGDPLGSSEGWLEATRTPQHHPAAPSKASEEAAEFGPEDAPYRLLERLGRGANAVVYKCARGSETFAVKVINLDRLRMRPDFEHLLQILDRETSILWTLRHEKIVQLRDVVRTPRRLYLVMDLVEGGELMDHIMSRGRLPEKEARHVFVQIVSGLQYIHGKSIIHRDLKPENILVDSAASQPGVLDVRLSDFGHSKLINDGYTCAHTVVGTPQYWAPEAAEAHLSGPQGYDERADLWSLGVVLYVMLEGAYPFENTHAARTAHFHFSGSREAERLLRGLLRSDPAERMTLAQCLESAWVVGGPRAGLPKAQSQDQGEEEVHVKLPRAPGKVSRFRADLAAYSNEHQVPATLRLLEVVVSFRSGTAAEDVRRAREALEQLVARHFPECSGRPPNARGGPPALEDAASCLEEERVSLAAIYGAEFEALDEREWRVSLGEGRGLRVHLPRGYPQKAPPELHLEGPCGESGAALLKELAANWAPGDACVYQWTELLREALGGSAVSQGEEEEADVPATRTDDAGGLVQGGWQHCSAGSAAGDEACDEFNYQPQFRAPGRGPKSIKQGQRQRRFGTDSADPAHTVNLLHGEPLVDRKSTFQAHLACVRSMEQVNWAHRQLLSERKIASATHNTIAYRFHDTATGSIISDHDDDHESGAGSILASLLRWCGDQGVFLMVTRWYGGIELGPERFRHIKRVAQRLLGAQGLLKEVTAQKKGPATRKG